MVENRFKNKSLNDIIGDNWFGDNTIEEITEEDIKSLPEIFPEANLTSEEINYLIDLKNGYWNQ